jgi:hypothetical protein
MLFSVVNETLRNPGDGRARTTGNCSQRVVRGGPGTAVLSSSAAPTASGKCRLRPGPPVGQNVESLIPLEVQGRSPWSLFFHVGGDARASVASLSCSGERDVRSFGSGLGAKCLPAR